MPQVPRPVWVMLPLALALLGYCLLPSQLARDVGYPIVGLVSVVAAGVGIARNAVRRTLGWTLVLAGFTGWVLGDACFTLQQRWLGIEAYPAPSDAVYIVSYALMAAGLVVMVRRRGTGDLPAMLDAAILATGTAVVVGVFVLAPIAQDSSLTLIGKLTSSMYPIADVLLLGILARLWTTPGSRTAAFRLLGASLVMTLLGDVLYNITTIVGASLASSVTNDVLWLTGYVLVAGAAWATSVHDLAEPSPGREDLSDPLKRLVVLTGGLVLPAAALLGDGVIGGGESWAIIAAGSIVMSGLVLGRMAGLLSVVRGQAVTLAALARSDALTGIPNRRTWDHELSRACHTAREHQTPLSVALLDLDHFKLYNDAYGHPAGDRLLREASAAWVDLLEDQEMLARYGGEEFAILFPGRSAREARDRVRLLLEHTPGSQTFSAGVATWDPDTEPSAALAAADIALYNAKRGGRDQVCLSVQETAETEQLTPSIVLQPILDIVTRLPVAVEALSRFPEGEPLTVFDAARRAGRGPELEAAAIKAAFTRRVPGLKLAVNVSLDVLASPVVEDALSGDLTHIILEITEHADITAPDVVVAAVERYRARGATIAVDDWGKGFSNVERLLLLRPELVKLDMSLIGNLDDVYHVAVIQTVTMWAELVGAQVCAEGIETEQQWHQLVSLGVHLGQGFFFGRPAARFESFDMLAVHS